MDDPKRGGGAGQRQHDPPPGVLEPSLSIKSMQNIWSLDLTLA